MSCPHCDECTFMSDRLSHMPTVSEMYEHHYCSGDHTGCARFTVADSVGFERVPETLYPNDHEGAQFVIAQQPVSA